MQAKYLLFGLFFLGLATPLFAQDLPDIDFSGDVLVEELEMGDPCNETETMVRAYERFRSPEDGFPMTDRATLSMRVLGGVDPKCLTVGEEVLESESGLAFFPVIPGSKPGAKPKPKVEQRPNDPSGKKLLALIQNTFEWIFNIIEKNQPVVKIPTLKDLPKASALPKDWEGDWENMSQWKGPRSEEFRYVARNLYGIKVIDLTYVVHFSYGASFDGKGQYLTNVTVYPRKHAVAWGYTLSLDAKVNAVLNYGTEENPLGAIHLLVDHRIETLVKKGGETRAFLVRGDGMFTESTPNILQ